MILTCNVSILSLYHSPPLLLQDQLEDHLNSNRNLALLAKILHETYMPLRSLCRLPNTPQMGVSMHKTNQAFKTFITVPQSPTHLKVREYFEGRRQALLLTP